MEIRKILDKLIGKREYYHKDIDGKKILILKKCGKYEYHITPLRKKLKYSIITLNGLNVFDTLLTGIALRNNGELNFIVNFIYKIFGENILLTSAFKIFAFFFIVSFMLWSNDYKDSDYKASLKIVISLCIVFGIVVTYNTLKLFGVI